jgi:hypothetical protein
MVACQELHRENGEQNHRERRKLFGRKDVYGVDEIARRDVSRPYANKLIRQLNEELQEKGLHYHRGQNRP